MNENSSGRDIVFDVTRFMAMLMVVLWHCIWLSSRHDMVLSEGSIVVNFLLGCNMPLFFIISGYFARTIIERGSWKALVLREISYFWPVLVFSIVQYVIAGGSFHVWLRILIFSFWFFCCLGLCDITSFCAVVLALKMRCGIAWTLIAVFVALWAIPLGLWYCVSMIPFYWVGAFLLPRIYKKSRFGVWGCILLATYILVAMVEGNINANGLCFYWNRMHLGDFSFHGFVLMCGRFLLGAIGAIGILGAVKMCAAFWERCRWIGHFGRHTLGIYFLHSLIISWTYQMWGDFSGQEGLLVLFAAVVFVACHYIVALTKMVPLVNGMLWGPTFFKQKLGVRK